MSRQSLEWLLVEGGPIETASAILYFFAAALLYFDSLRSGWSVGPTGAVILSVGGLRELDFHSRFTHGHTLSFNYYFAGTAPLWEIALVLTALSSLATFAVWFLKRNWGAFLAALRARRRWADSVLAAVVVIGASAGLDRAAGLLYRNFPPFGDNGVFVLWVIEESLELVIPIFFITAIIQASVHSAAGAAPARLSTDFRRHAQREYPGR